MTYNNYLKSSHWKQKRKDAISRRGDHCYICWSNKNTQVHHRAYTDKHGNSILGDEKLNFLIPLCAKCHGIVHKYHGNSPLGFGFFTKCHRVVLLGATVREAVQMSSNKIAYIALKNQYLKYYTFQPGDCFVLDERISYGGRKSRSSQLAKNKSYYIDNELRAIKISGNNVICYGTPSTRGKGVDQPTDRPTSM
jgi:hypothetical protein